MKYNVFSLSSAITGDLVIQNSDGCCVVIDKL